MPLYNVQDDDRPMFVLAKSMAAAVEKWMEFVAKENDGEKFEPKGCALICDDDELLK